MIEEFEETGIVKLEGVFGDADAARMQEVLWRELDRRYGIERDDPSTWNRHEPTGLKSTKKSWVFTPICGPRVVELLDALFGEDAWKRPTTFGNVLVTMPNASEWRVPHKVWHSDFQPALPPDRLLAVKLWALFDDVDPGGGGTPQLVGSHHAFARYLDRTTERDFRRCRLGFLNSHPWLKALSRDDFDPERNAMFMEAGAEVDGVPLRVVECTGRAGDVYVTHPWVFHTGAPNATSRPRLMRSCPVRRAAQTSASSSAAAPAANSFS